jgi:hypothetical protein
VTASVEAWGNEREEYDFDKGEFEYVAPCPDISCYDSLFHTCYQRHEIHVRWILIRWNSVLKQATLLNSSGEIQRQ